MEPPRSDERRPVVAAASAAPFPRLLDLCEMSDEEWRAVLRTSAMRRAGLQRIRRSLAYAAAHLPETDRRSALRALDAHASADAADVREAISWAQGGVAPD